MVNTLVVNIYAGPGAGKSTSAAYIFSKLKMRGISAEYVTEYAKDVVWDGTPDKIRNQVYITGKQSYRMQRVYGKVDVIITDSPLALGYVYTDSLAMKNVCIEEARKYEKNSVNLLLTRSPEYTYQKVGRNQTEDEAKELDEEIRLLLKYVAKFPFIETGTSVEELDKIVDAIDRGLHPIEVEGQISMDELDKISKAIERKLHPVVVVGPANSIITPEAN